MLFLRTLAAIAAMSLVAAGCGGDEGGGTDAGDRTDSGGGRDASGEDAGGEGEDAGGEGEDAGGEGEDAGMTTDAGRDLTCGGKRPGGGGGCLPSEFCSYTPEDICGFADATGICTPRPMGCTRELDPVCGCDGMDYSNPCVANMAGTSVQHRGMCGGGPPPPPDGRNCDHRTAACDSLPGPCPEGQVREVRGACWGDCVAYDECYCDEPDDCSEPDGGDAYTCHMFRNRCGPYL